MKITATEARALVTKSEAHLDAILDSVYKGISQEASKGKYFFRPKGQEFDVRGAAYQPPKMSEIQQRVATVLIGLGYDVRIVSETTEPGGFKSMDEDTGPIVSYHFEVRW